VINADVRPTARSIGASMADVAIIQKQDTTIVTIEAAAKKLSGQIKTVKPGEELTVKGIAIKTVPAYNLTKFRSPGVPFHPKDAGHVGYLITVNGITIYHTGDSDFIPEMRDLKPDVALLPVSGTYVMTAEEAVEAATAIQPKVAIPMHVGEGIGSLADAERFREKATVPVVVKPIEKHQAGKFGLGGKRYRERIHARTLNSWKWRKLMTESQYPYSTYLVP
jgi:L-ascorbate metabolism protein UlaG (beta-lactamase superfamily)